MIAGDTWGARIIRGRAWLTRSFIDVGADRLWRLSLVALAIILQGALDLPRDALSAAIGARLGIVTLLVLLASILLPIWAIVAPPLRRGRTPARGLVVVTLILAGVAGVIGVRQIGLMLVESVTHTTYVNDGTTLDHDAALELLRGHDPYESVTITGAVAALGQSPQYATPLRAGNFADRPWLDYPHADALRAVFAAQTDPTRAPPELESHVSYPALSFLALVPFVAVGLPSVILFSVLCLGIFAWLALRAVDPTLRPWVGLLILIDTPLLSSALTGALDVTALLLLFVAWLRWRDGVWSAIFLGLAIATKQQPWFFVPFYAIFVAQRTGWRDALTRLVGAGGVFAAINAPFILHDAHAWLAGVFAPLSDPMFPRGQGLVQLALAGVLPLWPQRVYTALELLALVAAVIWYWRIGARRYPALAFVIALLPLWFAWRSLSSYFYFSALPMMVLYLAWEGEGRDTKGAKEGKDTKMSDEKQGARAPRLGDAASPQTPLALHELQHIFLRVLHRLRALRVASLLTPRAVWLLWGLSSAALLVNLIVGRHYCDPQFYQYAGDVAVGRLPYRDVAVEYPPLAILIMLIPALPLLPFGGIAPRPDANPHPLHPDPLRYGAYGISFGVCMLLLSALTLWLVLRVAPRRVPGDARGVWSGLLYVALVFGSGAVLQKFDLAVGLLCLVAVLALLEDHDAFAWAALVAATLIKGFPILLAPLFILWRIAAPQMGRLRVDWDALRRGMVGAAVCGAALVLPVVVLSGVAPLIHSVAYHTGRGIEIESVPASIVLAAGWLPGMGVITGFDVADLSRDVHAPLGALVAAGATPVLVILGLALSFAFWYNGRGMGRNGREQLLLVAASALLLSFIVTFRALPLHYILAVVPLAALVRLPGRRQMWWLGGLLGTCVLGQVVITWWHALVLLQPIPVLLLILRNVCLVAAGGILVSGIVPRIQWKEVHDGFRAALIAHRG